MKILFLSPAANLGGAERCLLDLAASIAAVSRQTKMGLIAGADGPLLDQATALGVRVFRLPLGARLATVGDSAQRSAKARPVRLFAPRAIGAMAEAVEYTRQLRAVIREFSPSVVHSNGNKMHLLAALARGPSPLIWHVHDFISDRPLILRAMRLCAWRVHGAIAISKAIAADVRPLLPRLPITTVLNAIDTNVFAPFGLVADVDQLAGRDSARAARPIRVGLVATYARWKGHDVFLQAAHQLAAWSGLSDVRFYIIGGPIYETEGSQYEEYELRARAAELGLANIVSFVPFQHRIQDVYRSLDIVVHASTRPEPFGRTIIEGMASGRAVVVSRDGGASELFHDGVDAIGVPSGDPTALANALRELTGDAHRRILMGIAARATAVRRFSRARLATEVFAAYRRAGVPAPENAQRVLGCL